MVEIHQPGSLLHSVQEITAVSYIMHFEADVMAQLGNDISLLCASKNGRKLTP